MTIGRKYALWIVSILIAVGAVTAYVFYTIETRAETAKLDLFGRMAGRIIEESLLTFMQMRDNPGLSKKLDDVKTSAETISGILLLNRDGVVKAATNKELINKKFGINDAGCRECHEKGSKGLLVSRGTVLRWASHIENKPACQACHLSLVKNNGVLIIDFSVAEFKQHVREELLKGFVIFGSSIVLMGIIMVLLSRALITRRLERMGAAMKDFQQGGPSAVMPVEGRDEITKLETGFNDLAHAVTAREREKSELVERLNTANNQLQREIAQRIRWEQMQREQLQFLQLLIDTIPMPVFYKDIDGVYLGCNKTFLEFMGLTKDKLVGKTVYDVAPKELADKYYEKDKELFDRPGVQVYEYSVKHADETIHEVIVNKATYTDAEGKVAGLVGAMLDFTERKRMEQALRIREAQLAESQRIAHIGSWERDLTTNRMVWSDELFRIFGYAPQETEPSFEALLDSIHPDDREHFHKTVREAISEKRPYIVDYRVTRKDGVVVNIHVIGEVVCDSSGEPMLFRGTAQDVTVQKSMEEALRQSDERLRQVIRVSRIGIFDHDHRTNTIYWSPQQRENYGFGPDEVVTLETFLACVYPEDRERIADAVRRAHDPSGNGLFDVEHRIIRRDGVIRWLTTRSQTYFEGEGDARRPVRTVGGVIDITERKRTEEEQQKLVSIIETSFDFIGIADLNGQVLFVNTAGRDLVGLDSVEEAQSKRIPDFLREQDLPVFETEQLASIHQTGSWTGELELRHFKTGMPIPVEMNAFTIRDRFTGQPIALANISRDITERKRIEMALRESEDKFRQVVSSATDAIMVFDAKTRQFVEANRAAEEIYGYTREEWLNMRQDAIPVDKEAADANIREIVSSKKPLRIPLRYHKKKDGTIFPVEISSSVFMVNGRQLVCGVIRDITERKKTEEIIQRNYDTQAAINWVLHISLENIPLEAVLKQSLDLILSIPWLSFESKGSIFLVEGDPNKLAMKAQRGLSGHHQEVCAIVPFGKCLCGRAAARGEVQFADSLDERHEVRYDGIAPHGHYCVPIKHAKTVLGVMNMYLKEGHPRDEKEIEFLSAMASALAGIIQRKRAEGEREKLIVDLRNVLNTVSRSHKEWRDTFDSITDMISIVDKDFTILKANRAFSAYYGLQPPDVIGRKCYEIVHHGESPVPNYPHALTMNENRPSGEEFYDKKTKKMFRIFTFPYHSPEGEIIGSIHVMRDITDDKEKEMRLIMSERLAALGQMASGIAHEINNPLASIAGCSEGLLSRVKKGQYENALFESYLNIIQEEVFRCKSITTAMLSFVRKTTYEKQDINLAEVLDKTLEIIGFQGRLKNIEIIKKYHEPTPVVHGNGGELRQVILAVVTNALDAMHDKGMLTIETEARENNAIIRISDTGDGISQEIITRMFDPFFTTKSERGGTGLGLSIARKIVANHNGHIDASSTPGQGTTFTITLPQ
jgi:PAS domain S-box-containing protein